MVKSHLLYRLSYRTTFGGGKNLSPPTETMILHTEFGLGKCGAKFFIGETKFRPRLMVKYRSLAGKAHNLMEMP
jgi:hypothetical protein